MVSRGTATGHTTGAWNGDPLLLLLGVFVCEALPFQSLAAVGEADGGDEAAVPTAGIDGGLQEGPDAGVIAGQETLAKLKGVRVHALADDRPVSLDMANHGGRPVLLTLWATWCEPCLKELPVLQRLANENRAAVSFIGVAQDLDSAGNRRDAGSILAKAGVTYPQYLEEDGPTVEERIFGRGTATLPAFALYDAKGVLVFRALGSVGLPENYERLVTALRQVSLPPRTEKDVP